MLRRAWRERVDEESWLEFAEVAVEFAALQSGAEVVEQADGGGMHALATS